jgi:transmembrane sensor
MNTPYETAEDLAIVERAHEWYLGLPTAGPDERAAFVEWLKASPRNAEEFLIVRAVYYEFEGPAYGADIDVEALLAEHPGNVVPLDRGVATGTAALPDRADHRSSRKRLRWLLPATALAAVVAGVALLTGTGLSLFDTAERYATSLGEIRTIPLPDGSEVQLNTQSTVRVVFDDTRREIQLLKGEALFTVARDSARPFSVHAGDVVIQALSTQFNVYRHLEITTVSVLEGRVAVADKTVTQMQVVEAGKAVEVTPKGHVGPLKKVDEAKVIAWRDKRLVFHTDRLEDIVNEFNRYNESLRFQIEDPTVAEKRFTGVFDAAAPESFVRILDESSDLVVERDGSRVLIRRR